MSDSLVLEAVPRIQHLVVVRTAATALKDPNGGSDVEISAGVMRVWGE